MSDHKGAYGPRQIGGVSLASFLQLLEQERKTCTLVVSQEEGEGKLFFEEGILIDAECDNSVGLDAAYILLSWGDSGFFVADPEDRLQRIHLPLTHILLNAVTKQDEDAISESGSGRRTDSEKAVSIPEVIRQDPVLLRLVDTILSIAGIRHYYLMDRKGVIIAQSSQNRSMGDFFAYCIISAVRLRKDFAARGPQQITFFMENGEKFLIVPGAGTIIGLEVDEKVSVDAVTTKLRSFLKEQ